MTTAAEFVLPFLFVFSSVLTTTIARRRRNKHQQRLRVPRWARAKMGQEESSMVDESTPPQTLSERSIAAVAEYIKNGNAKRIVVMTGAGISTAAGSKAT